jgi:hypothetical protein
MEPLLMQIGVELQAYCNYKRLYCLKELCNEKNAASI